MQLRDILLVAGLISVAGPPASWADNPRIKHLQHGQVEWFHPHRHPSVRNNPERHNVVPHYSATISRPARDPIAR